VAGRTGRFTRDDRLRRSREFQHVTRNGRRAASNAYVVLMGEPRGASRRRLGLTVSRKVGNAVVRNQVKRRVREWFRRERGALAEGDWVVIARRPAVALDAAATARELESLAARVSRR
jgi:ribonuclease P protein component